MSSQIETPDNFDKVAQLKKITDKIGDGKLEDISEFLKGKELSLEEYNKEYIKIDKRITEINNDLKDSPALLNNHKNAFINEELQLIIKLINRFKDIKTIFKDSILTPEQFNEKITKDNPIDLGKLSPRSSWEDIPLTPEQLLQLKPLRILAKTNSGIIYYEIMFNGNKSVLRYNSNSNGDEIAIYKNFTLPDNIGKDDIKRFIISIERQGSFQDVEMQDSKSFSNINQTINGMGIGAGAGASAVGLTGAGGFMASTPPGWIASLVAVGGVVIGGVVAAATDLDYTTADYQQDFGSEIDKLNYSIGKTTYKKSN